MKNTENRFIDIPKARPIHQEPIGSLTIVAHDPVPEFDKLAGKGDCLEAARRFYDERAHRFVEALLAYCPQGFTDRVLVALMAEKVKMSLYVGPEQPK